MCDASESCMGRSDIQKPNTTLYFNEVKCKIDMVLHSILQLSFEKQSSNMFWCRIKENLQLSEKFIKTLTLLAAKNHTMI